MVDGLAIRQGVGFSVVGLGSGRIEFDFQNREFVKNVLCGETSRFLRASLCSISRLPPDFDDASRVPWALIRAYYSAYYATHAFLRMQGETLTYLNNENIGTVRRLITATGGSLEGLHAGQYQFTLNAAKSGFAASRVTTADGGAHEALWRALDRTLDQGAAEALESGLLTKNEGQQVFAKLEEVRRVLCAQGCNGGNWLSAVRNAIQYRHDYNTWPPSNLRKRERIVLASIIENWKTDPMRINIETALGGDLGKFTAASTFLVSMAYHLLLRLTEGSPHGRKCFIYQSTRQA